MEKAPWPEGSLQPGLSLGPKIIEMCAKLDFQIMINLFHYHCDHNCHHQLISWQFHKTYKIYHVPAPPSPYLTFPYSSMLECIPCFKASLTLSLGKILATHNKERSQKTPFLGESFPNCVNPHTQPRVFVRCGNTKGEIRVKEGDFRGGLGGGLGIGHPIHPYLGQLSKKRFFWDLPYCIFYDHHNNHMCLFPKLSFVLESNPCSNSTHTSTR